MPLHSKTHAFLACLSGVQARSGGRYHKARCPVHDDHEPSLDVEEGEKGIVLFCRSRGCSYADICKAIGWEVEELFWTHSRNGVHSNFSTNGHVQLKERPVAKKSSVRADSRTVEHIYRAVDGTPLFRVQRVETPNPDHPKGYTKECYAAHWNGETWKTGLGERERVLYQLDLIAKFEREGHPRRCVWVEGENKADALRGVKILATTALGGTKAPLPDLSPLAGWEVPILPDHDPPGYEYAERIREALTEAGATAWVVDNLVSLCPPEALYPSWDVANYLAAEGPLEPLRALLEPPPPQPLTYRLLSVRELLDEKAPCWQVENTIQEKSLFMLFGQPGHGKSFVGMDLLLNLSWSETWCRRAIHKPGPTVMFNLDGGGGFRDRVEAWFDANDADKDGTPFYTLNSQFALTDPRALGELFRSLDALPEKPVAMLIDTYSRSMAGKNENDQGEASLAVLHLDKLRERYDCSVGVIHHTDMSGSHARGSTVLIGAVDSAFKVIQTSGRISFVATKQRNGSDRVPGIQFELRPLAGSRQVVLWHEGAIDPFLNQQECENALLGFFSTVVDATGKEAMDATGYGRYRVAAALNSLIKQELLEVAGNRHPADGGRPARTYRVRANSRPL